MQKVLVYILFLSLGTSLLKAQNHEIGVFLGGSNPIADVGRGAYVYPSKLAIGGLYKWNLHDRFSLRAQLIKTTLLGNDKQSDVIGKQMRGFRFENRITELMGGFEYNFYPFSMDKLLDRPITPYLFSGINYFWYDDLFYDTTFSYKSLQAVVTSKRRGSFSIPVIAGIKAKVGMRWVIALEVGTRFTFVNDLDGSFPKDTTRFSFGNKSTYDKYTFAGLILTYTFGEDPCYCK